MRFVPKPAEEIPPHSKSAAKTSTVDKTTTETVDKTSTPLGSLLGIKKRKTTTTEEDVFSLVSALAHYVVVDEDAARRMLGDCRTACGNVSLEEIIAVVHLKASAIARNRSITNPLGLLVRAVPQCFVGAAAGQLRAQLAKEKEYAAMQEQERKRQEAEVSAIAAREYRRCKQILDDPTATEAQKQSAVAQLRDLQPLLQDTKAAT